MLQARLVRELAQRSLHLLERRLKLTLGLHAPHLRRAAIHEFVALAILRQSPHALGGGAGGVELKRLAGQFSGRLPVRIQSGARMLHQSRGQRGTEDGVFLVEAVGAPQYLDGLRKAALRTQVLAFHQQVLCFRRTGDALGGELFELHEFGILGKLDRGALEQLACLRVVPGTEEPIDALHPLRLGVGKQLLIAAAADALHLEIETGVLAVDGFQDLPLSEGVRVLAVIFVGLGFDLNRLHQVALLPHGAQRALEVRLARIALQGVGENGDALLEVGLGLDPAIDLRDAVGEFLALTLLDVKFQRLEQRLPGVKRQLLFTDAPVPRRNCRPPGSCARFRRRS